MSGCSGNRWVRIADPPNRFEKVLRVRVPHSLVVVSMGGSNRAVATDLVGARRETEAPLTTISHSAPRRARRHGGHPRHVFGERAASDPAYRVPWHVGLRVPAHSLLATSPSERNLPTP